MGNKIKVLLTARFAKFLYFFRISAKNRKDQNKSNNHQSSRNFRTGYNFIKSFQNHLALSNTIAKYNDTTKSKVLLIKFKGENGKNAKGMARKYPAEILVKNPDMTLKSEDNKTILFTKNSLPNYA